MSTELIERYLRTRGHRFFRGRHDGEFFFILTAERLHVHLETSRGEGDSITVRVIPGYFYPAADRAHVMQVVEAWDNGDVNAVVVESTDPNRVGLAAESSCPGTIAFADFAAFADDTIRSAADLFRAIGPAPPAQAWLPDAS